MDNKDPGWTNCQSDSKDKGGNVTAKEQANTAIVEAMMQRPQLAELLSLARKTYVRLEALRGSTNNDDCGGRKGPREDG